MFYTTEIIEIRVILFFYLKASLSTCLSVSLSPPSLFLCLQLNLWPLFFYFYKKDLMFAMFMYKYDQVKTLSMLRVEVSDTNQRSNKLFFCAISLFLEWLCDFSCSLNKNYSTFWYYIYWYINEHNNLEFQLITEIEPPRILMIVHYV